MNTRDHLAETSQPIVRETRYGLVEGRIDQGICRFLGIPYAAPPVGRNRFAKPQPVASWTGARDATRPGPSPPQKIGPFPALDVVSLVGDGGERGDDYLTLNIWAP